MSNARNLANLLGTGTQITTADIADGAFQANKNIIINGAVTVNQRGNQTTTNGGSVYFVDRFNVFHNSAAAVANLQQSTDTPSGQGFGNSMLIDVTTADTSIAAGEVAVLRQILEGQNLQQLKYGTSSAESLTLSFWVKSSKTGVHICELYHNDSQAKTQSQSYTISSANTWEKHSVTFSGDTAATLDNDNQYTIAVQWGLFAGTDFSSGTLQTTWANLTNANRFAGQVNLFDSTSNNFYLTGVQLEVGETATPFEHRSYGEELARCQRYYFRTSNASAGYQNLATCAYIGSTIFRGVIEFPVTMRAIPTFSHTGAFQTLGGFNISSLAAGDGATIDSHGIQVATNETGSAGQSLLFRANNDSNARLMYDAELQMNITSAQYITAFGDSNNACIKATIDGTEMFVPLDPANTHYAEIMRQVEAGELTIADAE